MSDSIICEHGTTSTFGYTDEGALVVRHYDGAMCEQGEAPPAATTKELLVELLGRVERWPNDMVGARVLALGVLKGFRDTLPAQVLGARQ